MFRLPLPVRAKHSIKCFASLLAVQVEKYKFENPGKQSLNFYKGVRALMVHLRQFKSLPMEDSSASSTYLKQLRPHSTGLRMAGFPYIAGIIQQEKKGFSRYLSSAKQGNATAKEALTPLRLAPNAICTLI